MQVEIFTLCEAANAHGGFMNILGSFDTLRSDKYPMTCPPCAVALRIRYRPSETGEHILRINFVDDDGKHLLPSLEGHMTIMAKAGQQTYSTNMILAIGGLQIPKPGEYAIDLGIDGNALLSLPLYAVQVESASPNPGGSGQGQPFASA